MITDIIVDTLYEENLQSTLKTLGAGRLVMSERDPQEPYLTTEDGFLVVRLKNHRDPTAFARELERRGSWLRIVKVVDRTP